MAFDPNSVPMDLHQLNIVRAMPEEARNSPVTASGRNIEGYHVNSSPVYYPATMSADAGFIRQQQYLPPGASAAWCPSPRMSAVGIGIPFPSSSSSINPSSGYNNQTPTFCNRGSGGNTSDITPSEDGGEDSVSGRKVKFLCSFGGKVFPRPSDGELRYVGGHTRIISVRKDVSFSELVQKMAATYGRSVVIKYQLPDEDLDALVSVSCPDDLENMMDEYQKLTEKSSDGSAKLRVFLFSSSDLDLAGMVHFGEVQDSGQKYVEAVNGLISDVSIASVSSNPHPDINGGSEVLDNVVSHVEPSGTRYGMSELEQEPIIPVNFQPAGTYYLQTPAHFSAKPNNNMVQTSFLQPQGFNVYPHGAPVIPEGWVGQQQQAVTSEKIPSFMNCYTCESALPRAYSEPVVQGHKESPKSNNLSDLNQVYHTIQSDDMLTGHLKNTPLLASSLLGVHKEDDRKLDGRFSEFTVKDPFFQSSTTSEIFLPDFYNRGSPNVTNSPTQQQLSLGIHSNPSDQDSSIFSLVDQADGVRDTSNSLFSNQDPWNLSYDTHATIPKLNQHSPTSKAEEQIKQELQTVAEGVAASVFQASTYPNPSNLELTRNNISLMDQYQEDRERNPEEKKQILAEKFNFGFPVSDSIGRLQIIKNSDLEELQELGSGTFGTVYHGKWRGTDVAIKRINERCFAGKASEEQRMRDDFWNEAIKLADLHHPNVVAFYGVVLDGPGDSVATVTEYMVNGSLRTALQKNEKGLDRRKRLLIAMDVAFGMEYLHGRNIVHFDLKSDNLLVNLRDPHRPICKVGDLGLSKVKCHTLISGGVRGTLPWMAPELLNGSSSLVSEKVDVFSFAIVMWELLTGEEPYANLHYGAIIGGIVSNTLRPVVPESCDPEWRLLMERCWSSEPSERPSFTDIANELRAMDKAPQTSSPWN